MVIRHKRQQSSGHHAFTILEIVIVLAITVVLAGLAVPVVSSMLLGEQLRAPARQLESMAITARCFALAEHRPYQIVLDRDRFRLERSGADGGDAPTAEFRLASGVEFEMSAWPDDKWGTPKNRVWYFPSSGLCEPIRVTFRKGESFFSQEYSAITGWTRNEQSFIR